jgi:uncharacterized membrane protein
MAYALPKEEKMSTAEHAIDVNVPVRVAYNQWTQFESFPHFMEGVERVEQINDQTLRWRANISGDTEEWEARITEQVPDQRIAWTSTSGTRNGGVVTFHRLSDAQTRVMVQMDYEPEGMKEKVGDVLGFMDRRVKGDLEKFKEFVESRGTETGAWRGEIHDHPPGTP